MGGQCSAGHFKQQFQIVKESEHPTLGYIKVIRNIKSNFNNKNHHLSIGEAGISYEPKDGELIGMKSITFNTAKELQQYLRYVKQANLYYKIPTLLRILSYQVNNGKGNRSTSTTNPSFLKFPNNSELSCGVTYTITIFFTYCQFSLDQMLKQKRKQLSALRNNGKNRIKLPTNIKLYDYQQIDKLPHYQRKLVNIYFQEVQILRMIDHVIGALYFLNHLQHKHQSVCPENILIDEEGKFILIDSIVFELATNYEIALMEYLNKNLPKCKIKRGNQNCSGFAYLSPQLLTQIRNKHIEHHESSEKCQVFSVGLIALDMCMFDFTILQSNLAFPHHQDSSGHRSLLDKANLKLNKNELNKLLIEARQRYSDELIDLLSNMLQFDPVKRITFSALIDILSPLLSKNLTQIQNLFNVTIQPQQPKNEENTYTHNITTNANQLMARLSELENSFQKIMNSRIVFEQGTVATDLNSSQSSRSHGGKRLDENFIIEDEKRILKELKKINVVSKTRPVNGERTNGNFKERREMKGSQLYDLYLNQYQTIKQNRIG